MLEIEDYCIDFCYLVDCREIILSSIGFFFSDVCVCLCFCGVFSYKNQKYSRAYVSFKAPEDVYEFAAFFNGHVFVNEKGI